MTGGDRSPLIWIPRPIEDAAEISDEILALGLVPLVEPVMTIRYLDTIPDLDGISALIFTSGNGVRAFVRAMPDRHMPVYAVGPQCADVARKAGFSTIITAGGDVEKLAATITEHRSPDEGMLLHVAATERAGDLMGSLEDQGFAIRRSVLYSADTADALPEAVSKHLTSNEISAVLLFSPRTAATVGNLVEKAGFADAVDSVHAICLSQAVADKLTSGNWASIVTAKIRSRSSMLDATLTSLHITDTIDSDSIELSVISEENPQNYETDTSSTPTISTETLRTYHVSTAKNDKIEGASGSMNAEHVIEQFGGIRPMAQKLGIAVSTVQGWKTRNHIPENRWSDVRAAAAASDLVLDEEGSETGDQSTGVESPWSDERSSEIVDASNEQIKVSSSQESDAPSSASVSLSSDSKDKTPDESASSSDKSPAKNVPASKSTATMPPPTTKTTRSSGGGWALFFALVALAGIATRGYWGPAVDPKVEAHLTNFFGPPVVQQASAVDETIQTDLVRTQEVIAAMLKRLEDIEARATALDGSFQGDSVSSVSMDAVNDRITALEDRLDSAPAITEDGNVDLAALESALSALRDRMQSLDDKADASIETFQLEINTFGDRLAAISDNLEAAGALVTSLGDRLLDLENAPGNPAAGSSALVLAVGQLESIADTGAPFSDALPGLRELANNDAEFLAQIDSLKEASWSGVNTISALSARFSDIAAIVDAAETSAVDGDWVDESLAALQSVVSVRRIDEAPGAPAASKAEAALARGDLADAITVVTPYETADEKITAWLASANARLAVDTAISVLRARAVDRLRAIATTN